MAADQLAHWLVGYKAGHGLQCSRGTWPQINEHEYGVRVLTAVASMRPRHMAADQRPAHRTSVLRAPATTDGITSLAPPSDSRPLKLNRLGGLWFFLSGTGGFAIPPHRSRAREQAGKTNKGPTARGTSQTWPLFPQRQNCRLDADTAGTCHNQKSKHPASSRRSTPLDFRLHLQRCQGKRGVNTTTHPAVPVRRLGVDTPQLADRLVVAGVGR